jgi:hypothetical protein
MVDTPVALTPQTGRLPAGMLGTAAMCFPVGMSALRRSKRLIRWHFRLYALQGEAKGLRRDGSSVRRKLTQRAQAGDRRAAGRAAHG